MMNDLTGFQRDMLYIISGMGDPKGLSIKRELQKDYDTEINHGRLYPNLDDLVDRGYVEKGTKDRRTNEYSLTAQGRQLIEDRRQWEDDRLNADSQTKTALKP